ncbi:endocuticle structural glycoprotein SgAbd-3-like [Daphnia pulex]|nr:endocuticle structural glycoprotein SgAbd-3-like [Daphnia pulex]XP_046654638.1 endocuticle structural glycoprotein SgAbd-3-like [Daphnia pulicaria]
MKFIIALAFLAVALATPQRRPQPQGLSVVKPPAGFKASLGNPILIVSSNSEMNADGSYSFDFESADGTKVEESGNQKKVGPKPEDIGTVSRGSYSYTSPDGVIISVNWTADENGFQATGDHLPTPPPMPEHVVKMLADLKAAGVL